jgi:ATP-dependent helicase/nuclease subunit A
VLSAHVRQAEAEACYEAFALLYVAMTRAKRAMYVITKPAGTSASRNYPKLLAATLGAEDNVVRVGNLSCRGAWSEGDAEWFEPVRAQAEAVPERERSEVLVDASARVTRRPARRPSGEKSGTVLVDQLFALEGGAAVDFGNAVHALLAAIEWRETAELAAVDEEKFPAAVRDEVVRCVQAPQLAAVWRRRALTEVWRERAFEIVLDGAWVAGVFDRVLIEREASGAPIRAALFDFKTDRLSNDAGVSEAVRRRS